MHFSDKPEQGMDFAGFLQLMQWPRSWRQHAEAVAEALRTELEDGRHKLWQHPLCCGADGEVSGLRDPSCCCTCKVFCLEANRHRRRQLTGRQDKTHLVFKFSKYPARVRTILCQEYQASENRYCVFSEPGCLSAWTFVFSLLLLEWTYSCCPWTARSETALPSTHSLIVRGMRKWGET